jgi:phospholipid/cholesterol/gamma-HCH transport system substrate-binding protein
VSERLGTSADSVGTSADAFKVMSKRMSEPGGTLDKLGEGADALVGVGQSINAGTLPRLNRTTDEATRTARQVSRAVNAVNDNPQSLIYGNGPIAPGPGEPGFTPPGGKR